MGKTVCLVDVDGHNKFSMQNKHTGHHGADVPNLALMKLAAWHKAQGDTVEWYKGLLSKPDIIYASKVFTFTKDFTRYIGDHKHKVHRGGTGYDFKITLPDEVENTLPDLTMYGCNEAYGFLTRGCIRKCPWCVVPKKEGHIKVVDDIERVHQGKKHVILFDNNFLAAPIDFIAEQAEKMNKLNIRVDFNQALDARLVTDELAKILVKIKWKPYMRFACDTDGVFDAVKNAIELVRGYGYTGEIMVYVLAKELDSALSRIYKLMAMHNVTPYCMPYRNLDGDGEIIKGKGLKLLANWCNQQGVRKTTRFEDFKGAIAKSGIELNLYE